MTEGWNDNLFLTRDQIKSYDNIAIKELRIPGVVLMENAGRGAAEFAIELLGEGNATPKQIAVICGPGNNGGDGFVISRHLINAGHCVDTYLAIAKSKITGDALVNYQILAAMNAPIVDISKPQYTKNLADSLKHHDLLVDALLGTGVSRNVEGHLSQIIDQVNSTPIVKLAIDLPSGLDADSGTPWGKTVNATATATFGHLKRGLVVFPGASLAGDIKVISIGAPAIVSKKSGHDGEVLCERKVKSLLPCREACAHKGSFGHLLVLAGSLGKTGAAAMTGKAAMRTGTGLVTIATTANAQPVLEAKSMEVMVESIIEKSDAPLTDKVINRIDQILEGKQAIALGPGLSTAPGISALTMKLLQSMEVPAVIDADGINIIAKDPSNARKISAPVVLTPHPGEMSRLVNKSIPAIQEDRIGVTRDAAKWHKMVIVLKGAHTVIANPDGKVFVNPSGNPGMASGGMGDILTGIIGGLLAQGVSPLNAALLGTYLHGLAGDRAVQNISMPSLIATDLLKEIPKIFKEWAF